MDNSNMKKRSLCDESSSSQDVVCKGLDEKLVLSPPPNLHPLLIDHIVQKIMKLLNVKDLKSARLVCKLWSIEGGEQLLNKSYLCPELSFGGLLLLTENQKKEFLSFLSLTKPAMFKLLGKSKNILDIVETFPELTERVRELRYREDSRFHSGRLDEALKKLPHLEILDLSVGKLVRQREWLNQSVSLSLEQLVSLKDIRLNSSLNYFDQRWMENGKKLNITKIVLGKPDIPIVNFLISDEVEWPLNHVIWKFGESCRQIHKNSIRQFFVKYSDTLKFLDIEVWNYGLPRNCTAQTPWLDDWLLPVNFSVLETMVVKGKDENIWPFLTIALRLPRLRKLVLAHVPKGVNKKIQQWKKHRLARGKKLQSLTIEEVELASLTNYSNAAVLWPNLKCLKVNLKNSSEFLSPHLFSCLVGLEKLDLNFQSFTSSGFELIQEWLMGGIKYPENYENGSVVVKACDFQSAAPFPASKLVDLKNLRSLTLRFPKNFLMGDFVVFNCLQFMTNLRSLHLLGEIPLSNEAGNLLETKLGETASVVVTKHSEENELQDGILASLANQIIKDYWIDILAIITILFIAILVSPKEWFGLTLLLVFILYAVLWKRNHRREGLEE